MPNPSTIENSEVPETSPGSEVTAVPAIDQPADAVTESASASSVSSPVGAEDGNGESVVASITADSPAPSSSPAEVVPVEVTPETPESTSPVAPPEASEPAPIIGGGGFEVPADLPPALKVPTMLERIEALEARIAALEG